MKIFIIFCITILSICSLDYLIKYLLYLYFINNKHLIINKNLPKIVYAYLNELKSISEIGVSLNKFYLYYFVLYLTILLINIGIYFLLDITIVTPPLEEATVLPKEGEGGNSVNNLISNSSFLLLISKLNNKIPSTFKLAFKLIIFILLILKFLGYNILTDAINDVSFLRNFIYTFSSLVIFYDLLNLYLLHKFATKNVKISEVLPDFIINWLKEFEVLSSTKNSIKEFKKENYINISIYIFIMIVITIL